MERSLKERRFVFKPGACDYNKHAKRRVVELIISSPSIRIDAVDTPRSINHLPVNGVSKLSNHLNHVTFNGNGRANGDSEFIV